MTRAHARFVPLLGCFFLSGAAGLVYQIAWSRRFGLVFGTAELAIATVLAAFLGGLGLGAALAARFGHRVRRPLLAFGLLELTIAASALLLPTTLVGARWLYVAVFGGAALPVETGGTATAAFYVVVSLLILMVPTACMGATLPLLTRFAVRRDDQVGPRVAQLYAVNTAGAVAGAVATGFWLLPTLGLAHTTWIAVGLNVAVAALALLLGRGVRATIAATEQTGPAPATTDAVPPALRRLVPWLAAAAGALALGYEVLWTRLLSHWLGGSTEAFATMLASFLVGIALGSVVASRCAATAGAGARGLVLAQLVAGLASVFSFLLLDGLAGHPSLAEGRLAAALVAGMGLLPGAIAMGATFPFAVRTLARSGDDASRATARVYAWNTLGAVVGSLAVGFWILPALGFAGTLTTIAVGNLLLALVAAARLGPPARSLVWTTVAVLAAVVVFRPATPWRLLRHVPLPATSLPPHHDHARVAFHAVGRSATVMLLDLGSEWDLRTNGLPEGTIQPPGLALGRYLVTPWLGMLPTALRPDTERMLVIGLGAGVVLEAVPRTVSEVDLIEIEPEVVAANRAVAAQRRSDPLADPRLRLFVNDARSALLLTERQYDAIVSQPSHPWTGSGHLYSREFFALVRERLSPAGVFVQWIGLGALDEALLKMVVATVADAFPHVAAYWPPGGNALLLAASSQALDPLSSVPRALDRAGDDLAPLGIWTAEDLAAVQVLDDAGARRFAQGARLNTDDDNRLQARSARLIGTGLGSQARSVLRPFDPWTHAHPAGLNRARLIQRWLALGQPGRAQRASADHSAASHPSVDTFTVQSLLAQGAGRPALARQLANEAVARAPHDLDARALLLRSARGAVARGGAWPARLTPLHTAEQAVVDGWRAAQRGDLAALRALDAPLATLTTGVPLYAEALRLRAAWRAHDADPATARQAQRLLAPLVARGGDADVALLVGHAAVGAGHRRAALATLDDIAANLRATDRPLRQRARTLLDRLGVAQSATETRRMTELRARLEGAPDVD